MDDGPYIARTQARIRRGMHLMGVLTALCLGTAAVLWCTGQDWEATRFLYFSVFTLFIAGTLVYQRRSLSTAGPRGPGEAPDEAPGDTERR